MLDTHTAAFVGRWIQTAVVPDDIHASMRELSRTLGAGPWFLRERGVFPNQLYQGQSSTKALAIAMGYAGDMQVEIIKQLDGSASVYREHTERSAYGLPHFGVAASAYQAALSD
jgi:hypothetical protein